MRNLQKPQKQFKFLNLFFLAPRMPITAKVSILHRISGVVLLLCLPILLFMVHQLKGNVTYYSELMVTDYAILYKFIFVIFMWALLQHLFTGIRHLLLDIHIGVKKSCANSSAWVVLIMTILTTCFLGYLIW